MTIEEIILNEDRNVRLSAWIQGVEGEFANIKRRPAIVILPGGAYNFCSDREAEVVAFPYLNAGYQAFILRYSVGRHKKWPNPLDDYEQAMELILKNQEKWHVIPNKIAVIGFSAGGHLATCAATVAKHRPNAVILGYAFCEEAEVEICQPGAGLPITKNEVDELTPPCFLFATRTDNVVNVKNTLSFQEALLEQDIQFESHIYAYGVHGFSTASGPLETEGLCSRTSHWVQDSIAWLNDVFGKITNEGISEPICSGKVNGNHETMLSVQCTLSHLKKQTAATEVIAAVMTKFDAMTVGFKSRGADIASLAELITFKDFMSMLKIPEEQIAGMDQALRKIRNDVV